MKALSSRIFVASCFSLLSANAFAFDGLGTVFRTSGAICTATLVGPRTLLTAYCLNDKTVSIQFDAKTFAAQCALPIGHSVEDKHLGFAICVLPVIVNLERYESIAPPEHTLGDVSLVGYGCDRPTSGGQLSAGVDTADEDSDALRIGRADQFDSISLCPGDSGGPLFTLINRETPTSRLIIGVNTLANTGADGEEGLIQAGRLNMNGGQFIANWAATHNVVVCGINSTNATKCNGLK